MNKIRKTILSAITAFALWHTPASADAYRDLNCIAGLSLLKDHYLYRDRSLFEAANLLQNQFYAPYIQGHAVVNVRNIDTVKQGLFKGSVYKAGPWVTENCW
jgi:hypothetical protein